MGAAKCGALVVWVESRRPLLVPLGCRKGNYDLWSGWHYNTYFAYVTGCKCCKHLFRACTYLQAKFDGSFMSIHSASMSMPVSGLKNSANSLSQYAVIFLENQSGNAVTPGQTTPCQIEPLARRRKMSSSAPRLKGP